MQSLELSLDEIKYAPRRTCGVLRVPRRATNLQDGRGAPQTRSHRMFFFLTRGLPLTNPRHVLEAAGLELLREEIVPARCATATPVTPAPPHSFTPSPTKSPRGKNRHINFIRALPHRYTCNPAGMMWKTYNCAFFTARRPPA